MPNYIEISCFGPNKGCLNIEWSYTNNPMW